MTIANNVVSLDEYRDSKKKEKKEPKVYRWTPSSPPPPDNLFIESEDDIRLADAIEYFADDVLGLLTWISAEHNIDYESLCLDYYTTVVEEINSGEYNETPNALARMVDRAGIVQDELVNLGLLTPIDKPQH